MIKKLIGELFNDTNFVNISDGYLIYKIGLMIASDS